MAQTKTPPPQAEETFESYIAPSTQLTELTPRAVVIGALLGMIFGASSLYLVLKTGLTVSASIPVAVISIALFRTLSKLGARDATILENNIVQTAGSAGESIAFGVGVTMPAILILGFQLEVGRVILVSILGGLLGILMMIPLRRALIVQQHGTLKYPEGTACAEVLKAGASEDSRRAASPGHSKSAVGKVASVGAKTIFTGFGIGVTYNVLMKALRGWKEAPEKVFDAPLKGGSVACEITPELLGVGYVIGPRIAAVMCAGGVLSYLLLIPLIKFFGEGLSTPLAPGETPIRDMSPNAVRGAYVLYIGAGAVAAGGLISLVRSIPLIWHGIREGLRDFGGTAASRESRPRTDQDLPMKFVFFGIGALILAILFAPSLHMNLIGALMIVFCGFLFVTVSSRLTGEIGSSSNPISGMTVATLLLTCLAFLLMGRSGGLAYITALSVGGIVCIASSNGGTTSQDLKTGFLVGATPRLQQIAILIGALCSALALGPILLRLNDAAKVFVPVTTGLRTDPSQLTETAKLTGPQADDDQNIYRVWHKQNEGGGAAQQYFVDDTGRAIYLVDPGINGTVTRRSTLSKRDLIDASALAAKLKGSSNAVSTRLRASLSAVTREALAQWQAPAPLPAPLQTSLLNDLNQIIHGAPIWDPKVFSQVTLRPEIQDLIAAKNPRGQDAAHLNRLLLEDSYPQELSKGGSEVKKYDAPKAVLMSYIIKGILDQQLPWALVLFGVMIAIVLEMSGIPSLAFAVGVYLPLSTSMPIFIGGAVRWLVDWQRRRHADYAHLTEAEHVAEGDKSPGVLMASGYIAGGAIAGIVIALMAVTLRNVYDASEKWALANNPFFAKLTPGQISPDLLSLIPFVLLVSLLYLVGREKWLKS